MSDASRQQVLNWCVDNKVDFCKPLFPPPDGWMWCDPVGEGVKFHSLTAIFTNTVDDDIEPIDVLWEVNIKRNWL